MSTCQRHCYLELLDCVLLARVSLSLLHLLRFKLGSQKVVRFSLTVVYSVRVACAVCFVLEGRHGGQSHSSNFVGDSHVFSSASYCLGNLVRCRCLRVHFDVRHLERVRCAYPDYTYGMYMVQGTVTDSTGSIVQSVFEVECNAFRSRRTAARDGANGWLKHRRHRCYRSKISHDWVDAPLTVSHPVHCNVSTSRLFGAFSPGWGTHMMDGNILGVTGD